MDRNQNKQKTRRNALLPGQITLEKISKHENMEAVLTKNEYL